MSISAVCEVCNEIVNFEYDDLPFLHDKCLENCIGLRKKIKDRIIELNGYIDQSQLYGRSGLPAIDYVLEELKELLK